MLDNDKKPTNIHLAKAVEAFEQEISITDLLESLTEGIVVVNAESRIILVNQRIEKLFGYDRSELVGQMLDMLLPSRYQHTHAGHMDDYFSTPRPRSMGQGLDLLGCRKDGTEFPIEISLSHLDTAAGKMVIAFVTDITKRKQIERDLRARNRELDAFAHTVAHDLNSSMSLIVGYSDALAAIHQTMTQEELHNYLLLIARNGRKMSNIISELLLFASMRKQDVPLKPLDMAAIVAEALRRLSYEIDAVNAEITQPSSYPQVIGYPAWVEEVWFNYISNALRYGGDPPQIELGSTVCEDEAICFWVRDNGIGLTASQQAVVFNPPLQTGQLRVKGHGLGLSIVRRIVEKLDGEVYVESRVGEGSKFGFILPLADA